LLHLLIDYEKNNMPPRKSAYYDEDDFDDGFSDEDEDWDEDDGEYEDDVAPARQVSRPSFSHQHYLPFPFSSFISYSPSLPSYHTSAAAARATKEFKIQYL
jgi:hypothetical protein